MKYSHIIIKEDIKNTESKNARHYGSLENEFCFIKSSFCGNYNCKFEFQNVSFLQLENSYMQLLSYERKLLLLLLQIIFSHCDKRNSSTENNDNKRTSFGSYQKWWHSSLLYLVVIRDGRLWWLWCRFS